MRPVFTCRDVDGMDGDDNGSGNLPLLDCVATAGAGDALSAASAISLQLGDSFSKLFWANDSSLGLRTADLDEGAALRGWQDRWMAGRQKTFRNATVRKVLSTNLLHHLPKLACFALHNVNNPSLMIERHSSKILTFHKNLR